MSQMQETPTTTARLPGAAIVRRIRLLLIGAVLGLVVATALVTSSRGTCTDDVLPRCVNVTLQPSPVVGLAVAVIVLWALTRVLRRAGDEAAALRILDRAALVVAVLLVVAVVVSRVWFQLLPLENWGGQGGFGLPFPFATVQLTRY